MQFDTLTFLLFLPLVLAAYHLSQRSVPVQNWILTVASLVFYGWFDPRLCLLLVAYGIVGFWGARWIHAFPDPDSPARRWAVRGVVGLMLAGLGFFKYFDFFRESTMQALQAVGIQASWTTLEVVLPIGISFYCFQSIAYVVDVHRGVLEPERDAVTYSAFMFFFPQLVAGPIERARQLLPQIRSPRSLDAKDIRAAVWMLLWGLFLKVVAADTLGGYVAVAFQPSAWSDGWVVTLGSIAFALQVYFDFNAYSLIAKGSALLFGIRLVWNFDLPYWSRSIQQFWQRWHISLSTWIRDYLFVPLGGGTRGELRAGLNIFIAMTLGGLWHGAGWNFILWGALHGAALAVHRETQRWSGGRQLPAMLGWLLLIAFWVFTCLLFRAPSLSVAVELLASCSRWSWIPFDTALLLTMLAVGLPALAVEAHQRWRGDLLAAADLPFVAFSVISALLLVATFARFTGTPQRFIYFQF